MKIPTLPDCKPEEKEQPANVEAVNTVEDTAKELARESARAVLSPLPQNTARQQYQQYIKNLPIPKDTGEGTEQPTDESQKTDSPKTPTPRQQMIEQDMEVQYRSNYSQTSYQRLTAYPTAPEEIQDDPYQPSKEEFSKADPPKAPTPRQQMIAQDIEDQYRSEYSHSTYQQPTIYSSIPEPTQNDRYQRPKETEPREKPQQEFRSRADQPTSGQSQADRSAQKPSGNNRQKAADQAVHQVKDEAKKEAAKRSKKAAEKSAKAMEKATKASAKAAKSVLTTFGSSFGLVTLLVLFCAIILIAAIAMTPAGILFTGEPTPESVSLSSAAAQINMELANQLIDLQDGEYEEITISGQPPDWVEVVAVFASKIAGAEDGTDVATLDTERVELLRSVFWDMCSVSARVIPPEIPETAAPPETEPGIETDPPEETEPLLPSLHITITSKDAEEMRDIYDFTETQNEALNFLLEERATLQAMLNTLTLSSQEALAVLNNLPEDLSEERRKVVIQALSLVGKVNYFWGGKSRVMGWDSRWGRLTKVTAEGSPSTGTYRPYGLDCSGFADWVFWNVSGGTYLLGRGGGSRAQHTYSTNVSWEEVQPGDLAFYPDDSHIGIVGGWDEAGNILIIHCASGRNNVVITGRSGFEVVARPDYYNE